ncbi:peptidoglycan-binding domain-containing protein [Lutispora thermophila]|uniref:Peptidoglycan-binding (PGRP) domain of peptidoglycan hydrolases-containing protein n=1 Tax=Lutispora thermophila DSM 19022 TaxID=1122184 RepID=A0A1M6H1V3_9FIRM|nr:peptidoglycan-binding domain-containing protein [Lutispora thermophila]SHJ16136.1 Peptidoglycan-binding (PGRP) domain of peptidoglycan hydrolases-containing protein [Lutispora thermophila DSM 19022]
MKTRVKKLSYVLVAVLLLSVALGGPTLGPFGVDVVSAATGQATPSPTTSTAKASTGSKTPVSFETASEIARLIAFGSYGGDVKLLQEVLNNHGYQLKVDGIFGKKTEAAVKDFQGKNGLKADGIVGPKTIAKLNIGNVAKVTEPSPSTTPIPTPAPADGKVSVKLGKVEYAAHGTKCFTVAAVAMVDDKIVDAILDDYQVGAADSFVGVPNSDSDFGKNFAEGQVLLSKRANAATYSANMAQKAGSTVPVDKSLDAIQAYVTGKTVAELEKILAGTPADKMVDAVSGATLVDTYGYVSAIVEAAKAAKETTRVDAETAKSIELGKVEYAAHGTKCFTIAITAVSGDKIVGAILDDYQVGAADSFVGVPNSDSDFGKNFAEGQVLLSKRANAATYSANMAQKAGSTVPVDKSLDAIQAYVTGKTVAELEKILAGTPADKMVDAVSGATLVDTYGYVSAIVEAAKAVAPVKADAVTSASVVTDEVSLLKAMSKDGTWIVILVNDFTTDKELVMDGEFINKEKVDRKLALYSQDENKNVLDRYTLAAPKLTVKSPSTRIQNGTFKGDLYVAAPNVQLRGAKIEGNVYFVNEEVKATFTMDEASSVSGVMEIKSE